MNPAVSGALAAAIAVPITLALIAKAFPAKLPPMSGQTFEILKPKYAKWEFRIQLVTLGFCAPLTAAIWFILKTATDLRARLLTAADFRIMPSPVLWLLPALFLALVLSEVPTNWTAKKLLGSNFDEFKTYIRLKTKYDIARVNRYIFWLIGAAFIVIVYLGLDWYVLVRTDAVVVNPFFGLSEKTYPYSEVQAIQTAPQSTSPNGRNIIPGREFLVKFRDGQKWGTNDLAISMPESQKWALVTLISKRSGMPIEELPLFEKGALY